MLVLHREQWGKTRWTAIEETAIKEACFNGGWKRLFFIALDKFSQLPNWLPEYYVRYNWEDFGLDQAVGAIKVRVLDNGGQARPLTPLKKAELLQAEAKYQMRKSRMNSEDGIEKILAKVQELFQQIERQCAEVNANGYLQIETEINAHQAIILRTGQSGMIVIWHQQYSNRLDDYSGLYAREFNGRLILNSELGRIMQLEQPKLIREVKYEPELSRAGEYGWKLTGKSTEFLSSSTLATKCVLQFMGLLERGASGMNTAHLLR